MQRGEENGQMFLTGCSACGRIIATDHTADEHIQTSGLFGKTKNKETDPVKRIEELNRLIKEKEVKKKRAEADLLYKQNQRMRYHKNGNYGSEFKQTLHVAVEKARVDMTDGSIKKHKKELEKLEKAEARSKGREQIRQPQQ